LIATSGAEDTVYEYNAGSLPFTGLPCASASAAVLPSRMQ
jgi:hypothetical protein